MNCPECGLQAWNYQPGTIRCPNDHVYIVSSLADAPAVVERLERFQPVHRHFHPAWGLLGFILGFAAAALAHL